VPATAGAAVVLALALVWFLAPRPEPASAFDSAPVPPVPAALVETISRKMDSEAAAPVPAAGAAANIERAPLPGEAPTTPITEFLRAARAGSGAAAADSSEHSFPSKLADGELEFAREPIDAAWAPGAEAELLARVAQVPGLKLIDLRVECRSTLCRLQMTQPRAAPGQQAGPSFNDLLDSVGMKPRWIMAVVDGPFDTSSAPLQSFAYLERVGSASKPGGELYRLELPKAD
jgi:hypothetical protein